MGTGTIKKVDEICLIFSVKFHKPKMDDLPFRCCNEPFAIAGRRVVAGATAIINDSFRFQLFGAIAVQRTEIYRIELILQ